MDCNLRYFLFWFFLPDLDWNYINWISWAYSLLMVGLLTPSKDINPFSIINFYISVYLCFYLSVSLLLVLFHLKTWLIQLQISILLTECGLCMRYYSYSETLWEIGHDDYIHRSTKEYIVVCHHCTYWFLLSFPFSSCLFTCTLFFHPHKSPINRVPPANW